VDYTARHHRNEKNLRLGKTSRTQWHDIPVERHKKRNQRREHPEKLGEYTCQNSVVFLHFRRKATT
jgi:hypothetical protein